jgi:hypothetical protein
LGRGDLEIYLAVKLYYYTYKLLYKALVGWIVICAVFILEAVWQEMLLHLTLMDAEIVLAKFVDCGLLGYDVTQLSVKLTVSFSSFL